jgi:hypothetical protein
MTDKMIPGGFEKRPARDLTRPHPAAEPALMPVEQTVAIPDRAQIERQREGGGAPSQRTVRRFNR